MKLNFYLMINTKKTGDRTFYLDSQKFEHGKIYQIRWTNLFEELVFADIKLIVILESDGEPFYTIVRDLTSRYLIPEDLLNISYTMDIYDTQTLDFLKKGQLNQ